MDLNHPRELHNDLPGFDFHSSAGWLKLGHGVDVAVFKIKRQGFDFEERIYSSI
jgi:hypothetical protein